MCKWTPYKIFIYAFWSQMQAMANENPTAGFKSFVSFKKVCPSLTLIMLLIRNCQLPWGKRCQSGASACTWANHYPPRERGNIKTTRNKCQRFVLVNCYDNYLHPRCLRFIPWIQWIWFELFDIIFDQVGVFRLYFNLLFSLGILISICLQINLN